MQELDKLIFPELCPNLDKVDDRLSLIKTKFHDLIDRWGKQHKDIKLLEFEAKIGQIKFD